MYEYVILQREESMWFVRGKLGMEFISYGKERLVHLSNLLFIVSEFFVGSDPIGFLISFLWCLFFQAEVSGSAEEENRPEFQMKQYDYFGHG